MRQVTMDECNGNSLRFRLNCTRIYGIDINLDQMIVISGTDFWIGGGNGVKSGKLMEEVQCINGA